MSGFIYIVGKDEHGQTVAPVKVGVSRSPGGRIDSLQTASPFKLRSFLIVETPDMDAARLIEKMFHDTQAGNRLHGEWFDYPPPIAAYILEMCCGVFLNTIVGLRPSDTDAALVRMGFTR